MLVFLYNSAHTHSSAGAQFGATHCAAKQTHCNTKSAPGGRVAASTISHSLLQGEFLLAHLQSLTAHV